MNLGVNRGKPVDFAIRANHRPRLNTIPHHANKVEYLDSKLNNCWTSWFKKINSVNFYRIKYRYSCYFAKSFFLDTAVGPTGKQYLNTDIGMFNFFTLIWETQTECIVMLNDPPVPYIPESKKQFKHGPFVVKLKPEQKLCVGLTLRVIQTDLDEGGKTNTRTIKHYWMKNWPLDPASMPSWNLSIAWKTNTSLWYIVKLELVKLVCYSFTWLWSKHCTLVRPANKCKSILGFNISASNVMKPFMVHNRWETHSKLRNSF